MITLKCSNCREDIGVEDVYCGNCGEKINEGIAMGKSLNIDKGDICCARGIVESPVSSKSWKVIRWLAVIPAWICVFWTASYLVQSIISWDVHTHIFYGLIIIVAILSGFWYVSTPSFVAPSRKSHVKKFFCLLTVTPALIVLVAGFETIQGWEMTFILLMSISATYTAIRKEPLTVIQKEKIEKSQKKVTILIEDFNDDLKDLRKNYIDYIAREELKAKYSNLYQSIQSVKSINHTEYDDYLDTFIASYENIDEQIKVYNREYVAVEVKRHSDFFSDINGKSLNEQQRISVVTDEINNLVVAGAGSGKTLTIVAKVKYLVEILNYDPKRILTISYTNNSVDEMIDRFRDQIGEEIDTMTFHKLGQNKIISRATGEKPSVASDGNGQMKNLLFKSYLDDAAKTDSEFAAEIVEFLALYFNVSKNIADCKSLGEYYQSNKSLNLETIKNSYETRYGVRDKNHITLGQEVVKSNEELMIANYLFLRDVDYIYEAQYKFNTATLGRRQYHPDFYLPEYDIYIEHFGVSRDGRAKWLSDSDKEQEYIDGMEWKRQLHEKNGTSLMETYSYDNQEGLLLERLGEKLITNGVSIGQRDISKVYDAVRFSNTKKYEDLIKLIAQFIDLFKTNNFDNSQFEEFIAKASENENKSNKKRSLLFFKIAQNCYNHYETELRKHGEIDFNDMINQAIVLIENREVVLNYDYVIVDEYQDIATNRFKLINAIRKQSNAKVLCVGDDWQSIFRFSGSNIDLFTHFEKYFGYTKVLKLKESHRNSEELMNIASKFVTENPAQLQKELVSEHHCEKPLHLIGYDKEENTVTAFKKALDEIIQDESSGDDVLVLGRNRLDVNLLQGDKDIQIGKKDNGSAKVIYKKNPELKIKFLTVHSAKGMESDNVIIINNKNDRYGFPNQITDDPLLQYVLGSDEDALFPYAEERRLFYVALTRARNSVYALIPVNNESFFVTELREKFDLEVEIDARIQSQRIDEYCPDCMTGQLVRRENKKTHNLFIACSNFPQCKYVESDRSTDRTHKDPEVYENDESIDSSCQQCRNDISNDANFCGECGNKLE